MSIIVSIIIIIIISSLFLVFNMNYNNYDN